MSSASPATATAIDATPSAVTEESSAGIGGVRQRHVAAAADASAAAAAASSTTAASLVHANQGRSASSAHICSNKASCPLIARWEAAAPAERDAVPLSEELFACSACKSVLYCCMDCQRSHWIEGGHKEECPKLAAKDAAAATTTINPAASIAAVVGDSSGASPATSAAVAPTSPRRRDYRINLDIACGPRALIVLFLLLYLIYRFSRGHSAGDASSGGGLADVQEL